MNTGVLNLENVKITEAEFEQLCQIYPDDKLERDAQGRLIIMPPVGGISGNREAELNARLWLWNEQTKLGKVFSSSTLFRLPKGGDRAPDTAWIQLERWQALTPEEQEKFPPICPDFVIELRSRTDSLKMLQEKMIEYLNSGLLLGWLINPQQQEVEIYRPNQSKEIVSFSDTLSGENVLVGFVLNLTDF